MEAITTHISRAHRLFDFNQYADCIEEVKKALAIAPDNAEAMGILINAHAFGDSPEEALRLSLSALKLHPQDDYIYFGLGVAQMRLDNVNEAIKYFKEAIRFQSWQPAYHANLAAAYQSQNEWQKAEAAVVRALELHPDYAFALDIKKQIKQKQNNKTEVKRSQNALKIIPEDKTDHASKAAYAFKRKDYVQAAFHYQQLVRKDPTSVLVRNEFLRTLLRTHSSFKNTVLYYPFADRNIWQRILPVYLLSTLVLAGLMLRIKEPFFLLLSLPFIGIASLYWYGMPYARAELFKRHFRQSDYAAANLYLPLQSLMQLTLLALLFSLFSEAIEFNVLVASGLISAAMYLFLTKDEGGELFEWHQKNPWQVTLLWLLFALIVPVLMYLGKEDVLTEGMI